MQVKLGKADVSFVERPFVTPLVISSGAITTITEATAEVAVTVDGREAVGRGTVYLSDLWAWPDPAIAHAERDAVLRGVCRDIAANLAAMCGDAPAHPLELGLRLHHAAATAATRPPALALAMAASPFDAAIHDAAGLALGRSAFDFYGADAPLPLADPWFDGNAMAAVRAIIGQPKTALKAWYLVCAGDGREELSPWVRQRGYRCFKLKLLGRDAAADAARTVEVYRWLQELGAGDVELSVDTNEGNPDADSVVDYLERLRASDAAAFAALRYLEQPTSRDLQRHAFDWRAAGRLRPILLDEGMTTLEDMALAKEQGWSGFALKTCKGHSFTLLAAAWARRQQMAIALQDLTNPGLAMIHAALFAAHVATLNDVELNSPQFTPAANEAWLSRLPGLFDPHDGLHRLRQPHPPGLGSCC